MARVSKLAPIPTSVHNLNMRTNVNLADDARRFAEVYAHANGISLGEAITAIMRTGIDALAKPEPVEFERSASGFPTFKDRGRVITTQMVIDALANEE
jgi:hypothetical protein